MSYKLDKVTIRTNNTTDGIKKIEKYGMTLVVESYLFYLIMNIIFYREFHLFQNIVIMRQMKMEIMILVF